MAFLHPAAAMCTADMLTVDLVMQAGERVRLGCLWVCRAVAVQKLCSSLHEREVAACCRVKYMRNALQ